MRSDDKYYLVGLSLITLFEIVFAVPLMTDSFLDEGLLWVCMAVAAGHFFLLMYANTGMVDVANKRVHVLGILALFVSVIPAVGFILHIPVAYMGVRTVLRLGKPKQDKVQKDNGLQKWLQVRLGKSNEDVRGR